MTEAKSLRRRRFIAGRAIALTIVCLLVFTSVVLTLLALRAQANQLGGGGGGGAPASILPVGRDFDGDGAPDFLTPRPVATLGAPAGGTVRVYSGATRLMRFLLVSGEPDDYFGVSVDSVGDVNDDGADDIAISAPRSQRGGVNAGAVYIFSGQTGALLHEVLGAPYERLGRAVAGVGDVNGDGVPDLAASCFTGDGVGGFVGAVRILSGSQPGQTLATITGHAADPSFGAWISGVGDLDGDGAVDIAIAAPQEIVDVELFGAVHLFFGDPTDPLTHWSRDAADADGVVYNDLPGVHDFGRFMLLGKDVDGDNARDLVVGSSYDVDGGKVRVQFRAFKSTTLALHVVSDPSPLWINSDANADLETDMEDLTTTIEQIAVETDPLSPFNADTDGDEVVTAADLAIVVAEMGTAHPLKDMAFDKSQAASALASQMWRDAGGWCEGAILGMALVPGLGDEGGLVGACCLQGADPFAGGDLGTGLGVESGCDLDAGDGGPEEPGEPTPPEGGGPGSNPGSPNGPDQGGASDVIIEDPRDRYIPDDRPEPDEVPDGGGGSYTPPDPNFGEPQPSPLQPKDGSSESRQSDELGRNGPGEATCDPVLIAEGVKTEQAGDLHVSLPGRDFELIRSYTAGSTQQNPGYPWMIGNGWGSSVDGWATFFPRLYDDAHLILSDTNSYDPFADAVQITRFPIENSSFFHRDSVSAGLYKMFTFGSAAVLRSSLGVRGESVPVWIFEDSGSGQVAFYDTESHWNPGLRALNGRILQEQDQFGNKWTYRYRQLPLDTGGYSKPRLWHIYLCGESDADAKARIDFEWDVGTLDRPGSGRVREARVMQRVGSTWVKTQYARYTYAADSPLEYGHLSDRPDSLVLVEQGSLLNAPESGSTSLPSTPEYQARFTHYRYKTGDTARLTHTFEPAHIERFAELWAAPGGTTQSDMVRSAAIELMKMQLYELIPDASGLLAQDFASKIVSYYEDTAEDADGGYERGHLGGMVRQEILQNRCGCAGAGQDMLISFTYKRRMIYDHDLVWDAPDDWQGPPTLSVGRWSRVTIRKEYIRTSAESGLELHQTIMNWSEDRPLGLGMVVVNNPEFGPHFRVLAATYTILPFVTANAVIEGDWTDPAARKWFTYHEFGEQNQPVRTYHASAIEDISLDPTHGLIQYQADPANRFNLRPAISFRPNGFVEEMEYDSLGREVKRGIARVKAGGAPGDVDDSATVKATEYLSQSSMPPLWGRRSDLVSRITHFPSNDSSGSAPREEIWFDYGLDTASGLHRDRVQWMTERSHREVADENGPSGANTVRIATGFTPSGETAWSFSADGVLDIRLFDQSTGALVQTTRNADVDDTPYPIPAHLAPPQSRHADGGPLTSSRTIDILGRPLSITDEAGLTTRFEYALDRVETTFDPEEASLALSRLPYLRVSAYPHEFTENGLPRFAGPVSRQWADASFNLLRSSSYVALPNNALGAETARAVHVYGLSGRLSKTRNWHDISGDIYYTESFEYDSLGRTTEATDAVGEITTWKYDVFDRVTEITRGVGLDQQLVERRFYDHTGGLSQPVSGAGEGNLTLVQRPVGATDLRSELFIYDWRNRMRLSYTADSATGPEGDAAPASYTATILDNLDRPVEQATIGGGDLAPLIAALEADSLLTFINAPADTPIERIHKPFYSRRGLVYEEQTLLFPSGFSPGAQPAALRTRHWFDEAGRGVASVGPDGAVAKARYDGLGRVNRTVTTDGAAVRTGASFAHVVSLDPANEIVFDETLTSFDSRGLPELVTLSRRRHDHPDTQSGLGADPISTFAATIYDAAARPIATVSYGVDASPGSSLNLAFSAGGAPPALPITAVPARSETVLVAETRYDAIGRAFESIDTKGRVARSLFDDLGRTIATIANYTPSGQPIGLQRDTSSSGAAAGLWMLTSYPDTSAPDENRVVSMLYDGKNNLTHRIAHNHVGTEDRRQVTQYVFKRAEQTGGSGGAPLGFANHAISNNLLFEVRYPGTSSNQGLPSAAPEDIVRFGYNQLGEQISRLDQNGTLFTYTRDALGRITSEEAEETTSSDIDFYAERIATTYDVFGRMISSRVERSSETVLNEMRYDYDHAGRLASLRQNPLGKVGETGELSVDFLRSTLVPNNVENRSRLLAIDYPSAISAAAGRTRQTLHRGAPGSSDDLIGRINGFSWQSHNSTGAELDSVAHSYVGLDRRIRTTFTHDDGVAASVDVVRDRAMHPDTGVVSPGVYPALDRFGRVKRHVWTLGAAAAPLERPALVDLHYSYDLAGNITERLDQRPGAATSRNEHYDHDKLNRITKASRGESLGDFTKGSEQWTLDRIGNWSALNRATSQQPDTGVYDSSETFTSNTTNELTSSNRFAGDDDAFEYDHAGNLVAQRLPDKLNAQGAPIEVRRTLKYDPWGRLVRVAEQTRAPSATSWAVTKTLAAYTYYAGNQRATRTARAARAPDQLTDPNSSDDDPDERSLFNYDDAWHLLEERAELAYTGPWERSGGTSDASLFNTPPDDSAVRLTHHIWDPTSQDQLAQVLVRQPDAGPGVPGDTAAAWALTDRRHDVVALVGAGALHSPAPIERLRYSAYGVPTWEVPGDLTGDGQTDAADITAIEAALDTSLGEAGYSAAADLNSDGVVGATDLAALLSWVNQADHRTALWAGQSTSGGAAAIAGAACSVGYAGSLYDRATGLWLMRHRWHDPELGRWTTRDPAGYVDGSSLYMYVRGNPLAYWDPFGLECGAAIRLEQRIERVISGEITEEEYHRENAAVAKGALLGLSIIGVPLSGAELAAAAAVRLGIVAAQRVGPKIVARLAGHLGRVTRKGDDASNATAKAPPSADQPAPQQPLAGDYSNLPDPKNVGPGKPFTKGTKDQVKEENRSRNDGNLVSDESGDSLIPAQQHTRGVSPPDNEAHVDHNVPRSKGGTNSPSNARVISRKENLDKSDNYDPQ